LVRHVFVMEYYILDYYKSTLNRMKQMQSKYNEGLDYHISKEGYAVLPYSIPVKNNKNVYIINTSNRVSFFRPNHLFD
jgi:hypothetical protein